jgi:hypothetical protein
MAYARSHADREACTVLLPEEPEEPGEDIVPALVQQSQPTHVSLARSRAVLSATHRCLDAAAERANRRLAPARQACGC